MRLAVDPELRALANEIAEWMTAESDWQACESCDMFQSEHYCGGYEADQEAFTFSYYDPDGAEWWFQLTPEQVTQAGSGRLDSVDARKPD